MSDLFQTNDPTQTSTQQAQQTGTATNQQAAQATTQQTGQTSGETNVAGVTTQQLTPEQQQLLDWAMPMFEQYAANPPTSYSGETVAGFTPTQEQGQQQLLSAAEQQAQLASQGMGTSQFLAGDVLYPGSNPALQAYIDTATQSIYDKLASETLPQLRGEAVTAGQYGGSRQGIAEGLAAKGASAAAGATAADIANQGYQSGLDAMVKGLALLPAIQGAQTTAGTTTSAVGESQQALNQQYLDEAVQKYYYDLMAPYLTAEQLAQVSAALPGGTTTTSGTTTQAGTSQQQGQTASTAAGSQQQEGTSSGTTTQTASGAEGNAFTQSLGALAAIMSIFA